jgi:hypothetical protein
MDESVKLALAKWPNVPHCYGWLALDARGAFRMRDHAAQAAQQPGDVIRHPALLSFIYRNYAHDARGAWYFQNGPQRVYVELETMPFIARTDPALGFVTHDGKALGEVRQAFMTDDGRLLLQTASRVAMLDDRDLAQSLPRLNMESQPCDDTALIDWLKSPIRMLELMLDAQPIRVEWLASDALESRFGFVARPSRLGSR